MIYGILFSAALTLMLAAGVPVVAVVVGFYAVAFGLFGLLLAIGKAIELLIRGPGKLRYWRLQRRVGARPGAE